MFFGYHFYADDTQIYISSKSDLTVTSKIISECVQEIKMWTHHNFFFIEFFQDRDSYLLAHLWLLIKGEI